MATSVTLNGTSYSIPATAEDSWGNEVSNYLIALASGTLTKAGGAFTLTADADFGATYGLKAAYFRSRGTAASAGIMRLANTETVSWRNAANNGDLDLTVSGSDVLTFNSVPVLSLALGAANTVFKVNSGGSAYEYGLLANANIDANAAIAATKIHDGSVSNTEFGYLNGLDSSAVGISDTQTLSNKKYSDAISFDQIATPSSPASGDNKLYFKNDDKLYKLDSAGNEIEVGSDTGAGELNYLTNGGFETGTTGWATYADAAGTAPVDGTGGSANITLASQTGTVLRGVNTGKITKDALNRQGEGISYALSIAEQDTNKKLKIQFDYKTDEDAAYANGDLAVYMYDVTNSTLITPTDTDIPVGQDTFQTSFNTTSSTSYRLIFHIASTNASAYDVYLDRVIVGPGVVSQGAAVGAWQAIPDAAVSNLTTNIEAQGGLYRRVGDTVEVRTQIEFSGTNTDGAVNPIVPNSLTADTSALIASGFGTGAADRVVIGNWSILDANLSDTYSGAIVIDTSTSTISLAASDGSNDLVNTSSNIPITIADGDTISCHYSLPVTEWAGKGVVPTLAEDNLTEWQSFTPDFGSTDWGSTAEIVGFYRRVGDSMEIDVDVNSSGSGFSVASVLRLTIPLGLTIDSTKTADSTTGSVYGQAMAFDLSGPGRYGAFVIGGTATTLQITNTDGTDGNWGSGDPVVWAVGDGFSLRATVPILEWAGSQNSLVGFSNAGKNVSGLAPIGVFDQNENQAITLEERTSTPADPASGEAGRIYVKGDKLIIQFNDGGTVRYKYLDLTGTGVTWVHTTTAP